MLEHGILTGRIFPSQKTDPPEAGHNFPLADWSAGPLLTALQERRMPLFVDQAQITWNEVQLRLRAVPRSAPDSESIGPDQLADKPPDLAALGDPREPVPRYRGRIMRVVTSSG